MAEKVLVVLARQEVEVWSLWSVRDQLGDPWTTVRAERDPKDVYLPLVVTGADQRLPGRGRSRLIKDCLSAGWASLARGCPELAAAEQDLRSRFN